MDSQTFVTTITDLVKSGATNEQISAAYQTQIDAALSAAAVVAESDKAAAVAAAVAAASAPKPPSQAEIDAVAADMASLAAQDKMTAYFKRLTPLQIANCGLSNGMPLEQVYAKCIATYPDV